MDGYSCGKMIGKGSFGEVFLCTQRKTGLQYVMKKMRLVNVPEKEMESFRLEVQLLSELAHPGIVEYMESFVTRNKSNLCIVMGYCEGGDLTSFLKKRRGRLLPEKDILNLFVQCTLALQFVHSKNILHRDLKSQNIFLKDGKVQLGDFGISKVLDSTGGFAKTCIGTPYYMSPELFQNKKYNFKSDIWALGCVLYEMATLKHAFDANSINGLAMKIIRGKYPRISSTYSKSLHSLVGSMLTIEPRRRPTMKQILQQPIVRKRLRIYLSKVFREIKDDKSKAKTLDNACKQLVNLGLKSVLDEVKEKSKKKSDKTSVQATAIKKKWDEQQVALKKEEAAHKKLEDVMKKYKEQNARMKKRLLEQKKRQAKRVSKVRSTPAERRLHQRLEEAKKRREARREREKKARKREDEARKKREAERKRVRQLDAWSRKKGSKPSSRPAVRKRSVMQEQAKKIKREEIRESMEDHQDDISYLQRAREELEKLVEAKDRGRHYQSPSSKEAPKHMNPKERVLYEKESRKKAAEAERRAELLAAQKQLYKESKVAKDRQKALYKHRGQSAPSTEDEEIDEADIAENEMIEEELQEQLQKNEDRLMEMKRTLHQTRVHIALQEDDEDDDDGEDDTSEDQKGFHNQTASICFSHDSSDESSDEEDGSPGGYNLNSKDRVSALREQCISELGSAVFKEAYAFIKKLKSDAKLAQRGEEWTTKELARIMGRSKRHLISRAFNMLDHLHFAESSFGK